MLKKKFFPLRFKGTAEFWRPKKTIFQSRYGMCLSIFLFLSDLVTCPQNLICTRHVEHWEKIYFLQGGMLKFTYKGCSLTKKKTDKKILRLKIRMVETCSSASSTHKNSYFWKTLKSRFLVAFQSFIFRQSLANFGSFGQILLHWQWLTCMKLGWNL